MAEQGDKFVKCPYYLGNNNERQRQMQHIRCEGVGKGNSISLVFHHPDQMKSYKKYYCCSLDRMKKCLIYAMLNGKYGVKDG